MTKIKFGILFSCVLGAGFYYGSRPNTYAHKFFMTSAGRFPANESARNIQGLWEKGRLGTFTSESIEGKSYSPTAKPEQNICDFYQDIKSIKVTVLAEASVSDSPVRMFAEIDCESRGESPLFLKAFCSEGRAYFREEHVVFNTTFRFENILDGFPRSWYIESADVLLRDGLSVVNVKPSQSDVKAFGKYTIDCSSL